MMLKKCILYLLIPLFFFTGCGKQETIKADWAIINASYYPAEDEQAFKKGMILVKDDQIIYEGEGNDISWVAADSLDAKGFIVCPGFIDPHTHALGDLKSPERSHNLNYLFQGVTTVFVGNDGRGPYEIEKEAGILEDHGIGTNVAFFVGHGTARQAVLGMKDRAPDEAELDSMKELVALGMDQGAFGLSTGLYYAPGSFSETEEVVALAKVAAEYDGIYESHMRDESSYTIGLLNSIRETIHIGKEADIPVNISHIKALGVDVWGMAKEAISIIDSARKEGIKVTADQYPFEASGTSIVGALIPRWVQAMGRNYVKTLTDPKLGPKARAEMRENMRRRGGAASLLLSSAADTSLTGKNLMELALEWKMDTIDAAIEVQRRGGSSVASFNMQEKDIEAFMQQPWTMTCSDGSSGHPRKYGSFPRKIRKYVRERKVLSLAEMIYRSTGFTAKSMKIQDRGMIKEGLMADLIIFNPDELVDVADFSKPREYASGMSYVMVNGQWAIWEGEYTKSLGGRVLRKLKR